MRRFRTSLSRWFAIFVVAIHALAPSITLAKLSTQGVLLTEICTAAGMKLVAADDAGEQGSSSHAKFLNGHCPVCQAFGSVPVAPAPAASIIAVQSVSAFHLPADADRRVASFVLHTAPPRGPPVLS